MNRTCGRKPENVAEAHQTWESVASNRTQEPSHREAPPHGPLARMETTESSASALTRRSVLAVSTHKSALTSTGAWAILQRRLSGNAADRVWPLCCQWCEHSLIEPTSVRLKVTGLTLVTQHLLPGPSWIHIVKWGMSTWSVWVTKLLPFFKRSCRCSFSSTKLNCVSSAVSKCQWWRNWSNNWNSITSEIELHQVDLTQHERRSQAHILSLLFLHHVTHHRMSISLWSFSKIHSNKQKLLRRRTTWKHRYTAFLLPCYMMFLFGNAD